MHGKLQESSLTFIRYMLFDGKAYTSAAKGAQISALNNVLFEHYHPCLCLCLGFSQITMIFPFLLMILHFSQIGFTDDLTFMLKPPFKK